MTTPTPRTDLEVLEAAYDIIQEEGAWCKGAWFRGEGGENVDTPFHATQYCLEGALAVASLEYHYLGTNTQIRIRDQFQRIRTDLCKIINEQLHPDRGSSTIPSFNDSAETTKEDALLLLKYGIARYQEVQEDVE